MGLFFACFVQVHWHSQRVDKLDCGSQRAIASLTCVRLLNRLRSYASCPYWTYYVFGMFLLCQAIRDKCG